MEYREDDWVFSLKLKIDNVEEEAEYFEMEGWDDH